MSTLKPDHDKKLEQENTELKGIIEQMTKEMHVIKDNALEQSEKKEQVYELRREVFKLQNENRRLEMEITLLNSEDNQKKEIRVYQEIAELKN